ncbi:MAG: hypothetical protein H3C31_12715 [Brumimicrobium sp.]|nr:hypothetical protein [Brumimicrobium sp.]
MIRKFIYLEWKQFFRSANFSQSLAVKIFTIIGVLYFSALFTLMGISTFFIIQEELPNEDPFILVNNYLIYWFLIDLTYRFFFQKMPTVRIIPLMTLPISKKKIIHYLLGKTIFSVFNILPVMFFLPFIVVLIIMDYPAIHVIPWFFAIMIMEACINFINFLIDKSTVWFASFIVVLALLIGFQKFEIIDFTEYFGTIFYTIYLYPYLLILMLGLLYFIYHLNYTFILRDFYIDTRLSHKKKAISTHTLSWLDRFGTMSIFLKNDIRLIWRNKRPQQVLLIAVFMLFYGLIFFTNETYDDSTLMKVFVALITTGGFLFSFGQYVPSWDSEYYKLLMSQNILYRKYIESKWWLMIVSVILSLILTTPYIYFGWDIYYLFIACAFFNMGVNSYITILGGVYNRIPVKLNVKAKAFENMKGFSFIQLFIGLPKLIAPLIIFYPFYIFVSFNAGIFALIVVGIIGLLLKNILLDQIVKIYQEEKYDTIQAYSENS